MNLTKVLRKQGFDLIDGPIRNHELLQLWLKEPGQKVQLYQQHISKVFKNESPMDIMESSALNVNASVKNDYDFNIGLNILNNIFRSMNIGGGMNGLIQGGKRISISYENAVIQEVPDGELKNFINNADFQRKNDLLMKDLSKDRLLVISGVMKAHNLNVQLDFEQDLETEVEGAMNNSFEGAATIERTSTRSLLMKVKDESLRYPIAVKSHRIEFSKDQFNGTNLVSDNRKFF